MTPAPQSPASTRPYDKVRSDLHFLGHGHSATVGRFVPIRNLAEMQDSLRRNGGRVVLFQTYWSFVGIGWIEEKAVLIAPGQSRVLRGAVYSITTLLLGWPSLMGIFMAPMIVVENLLGGRDVTAFVRDPPLVPGTDEYLEAALRLETPGAAESIVAVAWFLAILLASLWFGYNNIRW